MSLSQLEECGVERQANSLSYVEQAVSLFIGVRTALLYVALSCREAALSDRLTACRTWAIQNKVKLKKFHFIFDGFQEVLNRYQDKPMGYQIILNRFQVKLDGFHVSLINTK